MFETPLDRCIYKAIRGHTPARPQTLVGIIAAVDASQRMIVSYRELSGGLRRLVDAGYIAEIGRHCFCEASSSDARKPFSGFIEVEHKAAVEEYHRWFRQQLDELDDEPGADDFEWLKLVLRWKTPDGRRPTDEDEDAAEELAEVIAPILRESGLGEVIGFEHGSGYIGILVFGKATDEDVDRIYELVAPPFRAFECPPGSRIIRIYNERNAEVESDIVSEETI